MSQLTLSPQECTERFQPLMDLVAKTVPAKRSQEIYRYHLDHFMRWYSVHGQHLGFTRQMGLEWRQSMLDRGLAPATINLAIGCLAAMAREAAASGWLDQLAALQIERLPRVKITRQRTGQWLTLEQCRKLLAQPKLKTLRGCRDHAMLALFLGCGLRAEDIEHLHVEHLRAEPRPLIADLRRKGGRVQTVPIPAFAWQSIQCWIKTAKLTQGPVFVRVDRNRIVGGVIGYDAILKLVKYYGERMGLNIRPHDMRRTMAGLALAKAAPKEVIQAQLGHESVRTTERYLQPIVELLHPACDYVEL